MAGMLHSATMLWLLALCPAAIAQTTQAQHLTQTFERPTTSSLAASVQFFEPVRQNLGTTLPVSSMVVDESSATQGAVTVPDQSDSFAPPLPVITPYPVHLSPDQAGLREQSTASQSLPVKVDTSSTEAQMLQLAEFEKRNQIGEAFLLAVELVKRDPRAEFTYDAAIRNSLILGLEEEIEKYYREAIKHSELSGKYYVQLAHYYQRTGRMEELQKLISDYARQNSTATDYRITLARLFSVAGDQDALKALFDKQGFNDEDIFPLLQIQTKAYVDGDDYDKATTRILSALERDFGMAQHRLLLQELLRVEKPDPEEVIALFQASLANETSYQQAREVADNVIDQAMEGRYLAQLIDHLARETAQRRVTDVERWLFALATLKMGQEQQALEILTAETAGNTPIIAMERAFALIKAERPREAISILATLLSEQPDDLQTRLLLAEQLDQLNQTTSTLQVLAAQQFPRLPARFQERYARLIIGSHIKNRDTARLLEAWQDIAPQASFDVLQNMGDVVVGLARNPEFRQNVAAAALQRIEDRPDTWPLYLLLARLSATNNEPVAEINYYRQYLEHDRDNVKMLRFVAELALLHASVPLEIGPEGSGGGVTLRASQSEATAAAVNFYRRLIDLQPRLSENYSALMRAYQTRGEVGTAKRVAVEYADRASSSPEALAVAANMLNENGFHEDALAMYRASLLQVPERFDIWMNYALALREADKPEPASDIFKKILEEGYHGVPFNQPVIFANLLGMAEDTGTTEALVEYLQTLRQQPLPGKAEFSISAAKVMMQLAQPEQAREFLTTILEEESDTKYVPDAMLLLGQLQYMAGDLDTSIATFTEIHEQHSTSSAAVTAGFNRAEILRRQGNVDEAINIWLLIAEDHPDDDKALSAVHVAAMSAFGDLNNTDRAAELLEQFLQSGSHDFELIQKARQELENIRAGRAPSENAPAS